jgi:glycine cleavage system transcriptional repressor
VDDVAAVLALRNLNIEDSRMAVLGGEFALILLASGEESSVKAIQESLPELEKETGLAFSLKPTRTPKKGAPAPALPFHLHATGMDHPGIVHEITKVLHANQINIESLETHTSSAPVSGTPIFSMRCLVSVPASIKIADLRRELEEIAEDLNMDVNFEPEGD